MSGPSQADGRYFIILAVQKCQNPCLGQNQSAESRIEIMWQNMRGDIIDRLPDASPAPNDIDVYLKAVETVYVTDAYHSLSIEGYRVSHELIEKVRSGAWNPDANKQDREHSYALAVRGYWQAIAMIRFTFAGPSMCR